MNKPVIGINPYYFSHRDSWWQATKEAYLAAIWRSGGIPMTIHHPSEGGSIPDIIERIDGLLMVGGPDFHSDMYGGEQPELLSEIIHPQREYFDRSVFLETRNREKPILAICAGFQHINIIYGGSLYEDLPAQKNDLINHGEFNGDFSTHPVKVEHESSLAMAMGAVEPQVRCTHHQGIKELGKNLKAVAWSSDGLIEAIEDENNPRAFVATQWHPELYPEDGANTSIFSWLVSEAASRAGL